MLGLVYKDYIYLYKNWLKWKFIIGITIALILSFVFFQDSSTVISILITMLLINSIQILFISDTNAGWLRYLNVATNIRSKTIVLARIITAISVCFFSNIFLLIINIVNSFIFEKTTIIGYLMISVIAFVISIIYVLILIPFTYIFNSSGMIFTVIAFLAIGLLFSKVPVLNNYIKYLLENNVLLLLIIGLVCIFFLFIASTCVSIIFLKKHSH